MKNKDTMSDTLEQLVVFTLANESFGVDISEVSGIERMHNVTRVPRTPDFVEGVINLRGRVIPVVDLRKIFLLGATEETKDTRIVVVEIGGQPIGCLVDAVTEVLRISVDAVEPPSSMISASSGSEYLLGIAKLEGRMIILLDLENVLSLEETLKLAEVTAMQNINEKEPDEDFQPEESDFTIAEKKTAKGVRKGSKIEEMATV